MDKKTPFYSFHSNLGAQLVSFAGYMMPIKYKGINFEHNFVRSNVGVFDVSHMAQITIKGNHASELVQLLTTNDIDKLINGKVQYSCMLNEEGGIIDDLLVYRFNQNYYMLVVNASNAEKDFNWICKHNKFGAEVENITHQRGLLAIQGPNAVKVLQLLTDLNLNHVPYYSFVTGSLAGCSDVIISNTGYTGSGGFELYIDKDQAGQIWSKIFKSTDFIEPIGLAARDTLRLEMGYCLYGNDIDETRTPIEAGLSWIVKCDNNFIGKEVIVNQINSGVETCLVGFIMLEKGIPRKDYKIFNKLNIEIGVVTSGTMSPSLGKSIGMGYVSVADTQLDNEIFISIRDKKIKAKIIKKPFYDKD